MLEVPAPLLAPFLFSGAYMDELPFKFEVPVSFFEKASAPAGQRRRIGGIITTEAPDREGEVILQKGLEFNDFLRNGWFNDNHSKDTDGIVGYPEEVSFFRKGERLPNGEVAQADGHWAEGYLLEGHERADKIWRLGKALQGTGRSLGYSVEGAIHRRIGPKTVFKKSAKGGAWVGNTIAKATVRNVAVTNCPVNTQTGLAILAKSLQAVERIEDESIDGRVTRLEKALAMGPATGIRPPTGPQTGVGAGRVIAGQSLERDEDPRFAPKRKTKKDEKEDVQKSLTDAQAAEWFLRRVPGATPKQAAQFVAVTKALKGQGRI